MEVTLSLVLNIINFIVTRLSVEVFKKKSDDNFYKTYMIAGAIRLTILLIVSLLIMNTITLQKVEYFGFFLLFYLFFQFLEFLFLIKSNNS